MSRLIVPLLLLPLLLPLTIAAAAAAAAAADFCSNGSSTRFLSKIYFD